MLDMGSGLEVLVMLEVFTRGLIVMLVRGVYQGSDRDARERRGNYQGSDRDFRDMRGSYSGPDRGGREGYQSYQGREDWGKRDFQENRDPRQFRPSNPDWDQGQFQGRKRFGDQPEERGVRHMSEEDLRHKLEERRRGAPQYQNYQSWENTGQSSGLPMRCFNCNQDGHHRSTCKNPPFCYSCRDTGHKSDNCPLTKSNKGLTLCAMGMPGQLFYSLNLPEIKSEESNVKHDNIRAIISVLEGRGTKFRIQTELQYLMSSEWDWNVKRLSGSEFLVNIPSKAAMQLLNKMDKIKFITSDILAVAEETSMDPDAFQVLQSVWVRTVGIPPNARTEFAVLELAKLVGDPEEVHLPSLHWKSVWVKVSCKNPSKIGGTSEVFINKQGRKISWYYSDKLEKFPPDKPDDDLDLDEDAATDEEDPESQESHDWLESGKSPPKENPKGPGSSNYQGRSVGFGATQGKVIEEQANCQAVLPELIQEIQNLAVEMQRNTKKLGWNLEEINTQEKELSDLGFVSVGDFSEKTEIVKGCAEDDNIKNSDKEKTKDTVLLQTESNMVGMIKPVNLGTGVMENQHKVCQPDGDLLESVAKKNACSEVDNTELPAPPTRIDEDSALMTSGLTQPLPPLVEMGEEDIQQKTTKRMSRMQPTRHSSRIQDDGTDIFAKTTTMKATSFKGALWTIWKTRNDLVFNKKVISAPMVMVYKTLMLLRTWRPLVKPKLSAMTDDMINLISANAH